MAVGRVYSADKPDGTSRRALSIETAEELLRVATLLLSLVQSDPQMEQRPASEVGAVKALRLSSWTLG